MSHPGATMEHMARQKYFTLEQGPGTVLEVDYADKVDGRQEYFISASLGDPPLTHCHHLTSRIHVTLTSERVGEHGVRLLIDGEQVASAEPGRNAEVTES